MAYQPLRIETDEGIVEFDKDNAELYQHVGEYACFDHVFLVYREEGESPTAEYLWRDDERYQEAVNHIQKWHYPQHLYLPTASEQDIAVWNWHHGIDYFNQQPSFPTHWLEDDPDGA